MSVAAQSSFNGNLKVLTLFSAAAASSSSSVSSRNQLSFPRRLLFCRAKNDGSVSLRLVPPNLLAAEREEARAVLTLFLKKQGLSNAVAAKIINKSDTFIEHLVSRLHSVYKTRYLVGRELTTLEIRDALIPYLDTLFEEYGDVLVDVVENFPRPPDKGQSQDTVQKPPTNVIQSSTTPVSSSELNANSKKLRALARLSDTGSTSSLPPHIIYLVELGMELEAIKEIIRKFPAFAHYSLEGKIKPVIEFLLNLGVPKSDIPGILVKRPQLCGISLSENIIPTMAFLEDLGVDKKQWAKVITRFPALLTYSRPKLQATVDFLYEIGLSYKDVGKVLTRCPRIISFSVQEKLRPTTEYFRSLGVDVAALVSRSPQSLGLNVEATLKPLTEFFLEKGYSTDDISTMLYRYGGLYTLSLTENLVPKWEFFLTMGYPKADLVKFPQFFGYNLEERIKPRYAIVKNSGVKLLLNQVLSLSDEEFHKVIQGKLRKKNG